MHIEHDRTAHRFHAPVTGGTAVLDYAEREGRVLDLRHTVVPAAAQGEGVGSALVAHVFEYARAEGFQVIPTCPFVREWLTEHPEERDLVADPGGGAPR